MKNPKFILVALLVLPWLSTPFMGLKSLKRFLPAALLINVMVSLESIIARRRVWWWVFKTIGKGGKGEMPFLLGPFVVGSLWILKSTHGHFSKFLLYNGIIDSFFAFVMMSWFKRLGIAALVNMKRSQLFLLFTANAILLYGFQTIVDRVLPQRNPT